MKKHSPDKVYIRDCSLSETIMAQTPPPPDFIDLVSQGRKNNPTGSDNNAVSTPPPRSVSKEQLLTYIEFLWEDAAFMRALHAETILFVEKNCSQ